ncbi:MAG: ABC transporter permease [Nocardioides sp.]
MNATFLGLEIKRVLRDYSSLFFIVILPAFFYIIFGAAQEYSSEDAGNGNVAAYIMISMAGYGAATATTSIGGRAAVERMQGWARQLGLTPLRDGGFVATKTVLAVLIGMVPIALTFLLGSVTGAEADPKVWLISALALGGGAVMWSLFGLCAGLAFRSEAAVGAASGVLVIFAFLGNLFVPLSGTLLDIARFTPMYGYVTMARYALTEGYDVSGDGSITHVDLWVPLVNVSVWTAIFAATAILLVRRGRARQ